MTLLKKGFTLIELLVVIAIIGILAGIAFPVFARAKESAYRSSDMSNMNALRTALQLYKTDQGAFPPAILGYATAYSGGVPTSAADVVPADQVKGALFPKRIDSLNTLRPSLIRPQGSSLEREFTRAVWPPKEEPGGADPQPNAYQRFGPEQEVQRCARDGAVAEVVPAYFYRISGYDAAEVRDGTASGRRVELRYAPFWSRFTVPVNPCNPTGEPLGSANDDPRQLGYTDPPDTTVVTWNSYFRDYTANGAVNRIKKDMVLFLGGSARPYDSAAIATRSWKVTP